MDAAVGTLKFENKAVIPTDPRTKLFLTVTVSTIMITGGTGGFMNLVRPCLMACPIVFLLLSRKWGAAARFAVTYAILFALELTVLPLLTGTWNFILGAAVGIYTHMLPGFIMGYYLVSTTTVSEFVAAMEKMHIPQKIVIPMSVVFRFFPTVKEEYAAIRDAMKIAVKGCTISALEPSAAVSVLYKDEIDASDNIVAATKAKAAAYVAEVCSADAAVAAGSADMTCEAANARASVVAAFELLSTKRAARLPKKHGNMAL